MLIDNFIKGLLIIQSKGNSDYTFQHDIMYIGNLNDYSKDELAELADLGFHMDIAEECLITYS